MICLCSCQDCHAIRKGTGRQSLSCLACSLSIQGWAPARAKSPLLFAKEAGDRRLKRNRLTSCKSHARCEHCKPGHDVSPHSRPGARAQAEAATRCKILGEKKQSSRAGGANLFSTQWLMQKDSEFKATWTVEEVGSQPGNFPLPLGGLAR